MTPSVRTPVSILAWIALGILAGATHAADPIPSNGSLLLLHYRWQHDSLTLIASSRIKAAIKKSRLSPERRRGETASGRETWRYQGPPTGFSFELLGPDGKPIARRFLQDPGIRRVEYQEKGEHVMRVQEERIDSADLFLRIPEADARTIRFYRHRADAAAPGPGIPAPKRATGATEGAAAGSVTGLPAQGPDAAPAETLVAEFALP